MKSTNSAERTIPLKPLLRQLENLLTPEELSELVKVRVLSRPPTGSRKTSRPRRSSPKTSTILPSVVRVPRTKLSNSFSPERKKPMPRSSSSAPQRRIRRPSQPKLQSEEVIWSKYFPHFHLTISTSFSLTLPTELRQEVPELVLERYCTIITMTLQRLRELSSLISSSRGSESPSPEQISSSSPTSTSGSGSAAPPSQLGGSPSAPR